MSVTKQATVAVLLAALFLGGCRETRVAEPKPRPLQRMARFKVKEFVIGAWWGPDPTEANYRAYRNAGFNMLMTYRNRANSDKNGPSYQVPDKEFALAEKLGLWVMLDTYMANDTPWGGIAPDPPPEEPMHHQARPEQLKWLLGRYGKSPVLAGIVLGDDCLLRDYMVVNAEHMLETVAELFPWMATNLDTKKQTRAPVPLLTTHNYAFFYKSHEPEPAMRKAYCDRLDRDRQTANQFNMVLWPFLNCTSVISPSQLRFQEYACVAYGGQSIWYFHYNENVWDARNETPGRLYATARECNRYVASIGSRLIGNRCIGVFHSPDSEQPRNALAPGEGQFIRSMSGDLMAGLLVPEHRMDLPDARPRYVMVVNKQTSKLDEPEPGEREVHVEFAPDVGSISVFASGAKVTRTQGNRIAVSLKPGAGVLLEVHR